MRKIGDIVKIRVRRFPDGSGNMMLPKEDPAYFSVPVVDCWVSGVNICGIDDCYAVCFCDTNAPLGIPVWSRDFVSE